MTFPTPHVLGLRVFQAGATDAHGNPVESWGDPVDLPVHALAPGAQDLPSNANRDLSVIEWTVYAPAGTVVGARDRVLVGAVEFLVEGEVRDYTRSPWPVPFAGVVFELRRAEG